MKINNVLNKVLDKSNIDFFSNTKNYLFAEIIVKSLGLLSLPVLSRLLEPSDFGILKIYESSISFFIPLSGLALPIAIKRYFYDKKDDFSSYAGSNINFIIGYNVILFGIIFFAKEIIGTFLNLPSFVIVLAFSISFLSVFIRIYFDYLEVNKLSKRYSISKIIQGFSLTIISLIWIYFTLENKYLGRVYTEAIVTILFVFAILLFFKKNIYLNNFQIEHIKHALKFSLPIIPGVMSSFALAYFDTIIINQLKGSYQTGLYALAYQLGMIIHIINLSSLSAYQPIFYESIRKKNIDPLKLIINNYSKFIYFCASGLILFSFEIGYILSPDTYHEALKIIPIIILSYTVFFLYSIYSNYISFARKTIYSSVAVIIAVIANISLNYLLIPKFGYEAAAYTTLIAYSIQFILFFFITHWITPNKTLIIPLKIVVKSSYSVIIAILSFYSVSFFIDSPIHIFISKVLIFSILSYLLFKNTLKKIFSNG